jgi:hypothetical protein
MFFSAPFLISWLTHRQTQTNTQRPHADFWIGFSITASGLYHRPSRKISDCTPLTPTLQRVAGGSTKDWPMYTIVGPARLAAEVRRTILYCTAIWYWTARAIQKGRSCSLRKLPKLSERDYGVLYGISWRPLEGRKYYGVTVNLLMCEVAVALLHTEKNWRNSEGIWCKDICEEKNANINVPPQLEKYNYDLTSISHWYSLLSGMTHPYYL